jgi:hypothetical protein
MLHVSSNLAALNLCLLKQTLNPLALSRAGCSVPGFDAKHVEACAIHAMLGDTPCLRDQFFRTSAKRALFFKLHVQPLVQQSWIVDMLAASFRGLILFSQPDHIYLAITEVTGLASELRSFAATG